MTPARYWPGPKLNIQQLATKCTAVGYEGCWELREFVPGVDYFDSENERLMGCVARRRTDNHIFAAPDWRFCRNPDFESLWFQERRKAKYAD